jgi:hypothetical protein
MITGRSWDTGWRRNSVDPVSIISWLVEPEMVGLLGAALFC